jgi:NTE family protein
MKKKQTVSEKPRGNNPYAGRFNNLPPKKHHRFPRVAFVLQGGGSLGAYQFGVVKGLFEAGYEPDWIAATSIGAIQSAIIVGNPPEKRIGKLEQFWKHVAPSNALDSLMNLFASEQDYCRWSASHALFLGQPNFYYPRWWVENMQAADALGSLSYYKTSPLRELLLDLIDFDLLNSTPIRLSLGAVQVNTGHLVYFNNINYRIEVEHVMASGALPPAFPAIEIDGEYYWDGGVHSNTPLEVILEAIPAENTLCFLVDCFGGLPFIPKTMDEVNERMKDIAYSTHGQRTLLNYIQRQKMKNTLKEMSNLLTEEQKKQCEHLLAINVPHHCTLVHISYSARIDNSASKDYDFGRRVVEKRMKVGYHDVKAMLKEEKHWGYLPKDEQSRLYEAPNNHSKLLRKNTLDNIFKDI